METAEKCCQANAQFAEISEVMNTLMLRRPDIYPCSPLPTMGCGLVVCNLDWVICKEVYLSFGSGG
jgi:hypothetical protein